MPEEGDEDEEDRRPHELRDVQVDEISLVDRPANRRKFLLLKRREQVPERVELRDLLQGALNKPASGEDELLKAVGEGDRERVRYALRLLADADAETLKAISKELADEDEDAEVEPEPEPEPAPNKEPIAAQKREPKEEKPQPIPVEIVEIAKQADTPEEYEAIVKAARESAAATEIMLALLQKRDGEVADLRKWRDEQITRDQDRDVRELVEKLDFPVETDVQIEFVKSLTPEQRGQFGKIGETLSGIVQLGRIAEEQGTPRRGVPVDDPIGTVTKRAKQLVEKSEGALDQAEAQAQVLRADPNLFREYQLAVRGGD